MAYALSQLQLESEMSRPASVSIFSSIQPLMQAANSVKQQFDFQDIKSLISSFGELNLGPSLGQLPNEILHQIASLLVPDTTVHVMEGLGVSFFGNTQPSRGYRRIRSVVQKTYMRELSALRHFALVCRQFRAVTEWILYRDICLPQPSRSKTFGLFRYPVSPVPYLARTLMERPDLAARTVSLKIWITDRRLVATADEPDLFVSNPYHEIFKAACAHLQNLTMALDRRSAWLHELRKYQQLDITAVVISLLPRLQTLELMWPWSLRILFPALDGRGRDRPFRQEPNYSCLDIALCHSSISSLYIASHAPLKTFPTASLTTFIADMLFFGNRIDFYDIYAYLPNVRSMTVILNVPLLRRVPLDLVMRYSHPMAGLYIFLSRMVPKLESFAIEPPKGTEPHYIQQYDKWERKISAFCMDKDPQDLECKPHPRLFPGQDFWTSLLFTLEPVQEQLLHLSLPANWYSSTGNVIKPMPSLRQFRSLKSLHLPKVTIICSPFAKDYDKDVHVTHAVTFLPQRLEKLTLAQADMETCRWVQEGLKVKHLLPGLKEVHFVFREEYAPLLPDGFVEESKEADVKVSVHWKEHRMDG